MLQFEFQNSFRVASVEMQLHGRVDRRALRDPSQYVRGSLPQWRHLHPIGVGPDVVRLSARLHR